MRWVWILADACCKQGEAIPPAVLLASHVAAHLTYST
jgi:hypothetical protein